MTKIPIACTLTVEHARDRVEEWREFFATHTERVELRTTTQAVAPLRDGDAALLAAADLAQREQDCCNFFTFAIALDATSRALVVTVPDDAAEVLADFANLAVTR
jgi:hypothetical protein